MLLIHRILSKLAGIKLREGIPPTNMRHVRGISACS